MKLSFVLLAGSVAGATTICDLCSSSALATMVALPEASAPMTTLLTSGATTSDTVTLKIEGMTCAGCTIATRKVLERLEGVEKADVSYETKTAIVIYDPTKVTTQQMIAAVATLKYTATVVR